MGHVRFHIEADTKFVHMESIAGENKMPILNLRNVQVQRMYFSHNARRKFAMSAQRKPIGYVNIEDVTSHRQLVQVWNQCIKEKGMFSLLATDKYGKFRRCIAVIRVDRNGVEYRDKRCTLCSLYRVSERSRKEDMRI